MKKTILFTFLTLISSNFAKAEVKTDMVIASVNNKAITLQELKNRIDLSKSIIKRQLSPIEFDMIKKQSLEQLINEELKRQYLKSKNITVSNQDLQNAITIIEKQRGMEKGDLLRSVPKHLKKSVTEQIKDSIYDKKIIDNVIYPQVIVQNYEVDRILEESISRAEEKSFNISQISVKYTPESKKTVAEIYKKLQDGEKFENVAVAFSQGSKGSLGWFALTEMNYNARRELKNLKKGEFTKPFIEKDTWYIIKINDEKITKNIDLSRTTKYKFVEFSKENVDEDYIEEIIEKIENINGYKEFVAFSEELKEKRDFKVEESIWRTKEDLEGIQKKLVLKTKPNNFSKLDLSEDKNLYFVYILDKKLENSKQVEEIKERIYNNLQNKQAKVKFRTFLQLLHKKAFIEIR